MADDGVNDAPALKIRQSLLWASICNMLMAPMAASASHPAVGLTLRPELIGYLHDIKRCKRRKQSLLVKRRGELRDVPRIYDGVNSFICL